MNTPSTPHEDQTSGKSRESMQRLQQRHFHKLLTHVWNRSAFYREYYGSHGVREKSLDDMSIGDLPLLPKKLLIANFDRAVTDPRLRRKELEEWFESHRDPNETFCQDMIVVHGSGTSGDIGIFAYDRRAWTIADTTLAGRLPLPENYPAGKTRIAFYVAANGHFETVSMASSMPKNVYDTLILSLMEPVEQTLKQLNAFQPHRLTGYSSSVAQLAELALEGRLDICPQRIFVGGDKLSENMESKIRAAWNAPLYMLYAASESKYIAIKMPERDQMVVMDDLNIVEVLDENDRAVGAEQEGRVVLTNLYNYILPMLRYELGDYVVRGTELVDLPFTTLRDIRGRVNDALPIVRSSGQLDSIHPVVLTTFHVPTIEKFQFISASPEHVRIDYVAARNIDPSVRREFERMLHEKGGARTTLDCRHVPSIANDPVTGKLRLVKFEGRTVAPPSSDTRTDVPAAVMHPMAGPRAVRIQPDASFVRFKKTDIEQTISARFEQQAEKYADRLAVKHGGLTLTYAELNRAANRVAHAIIARRGSNQEPVALFLHHGIPAVIAILGILKAGRCYVPLDSGFPAARLTGILEEADVLLLLTGDRDISSALPFAREPGDILNIDTLDAGLSVENPGLAISSDSPAYLFFTSGSTGRPKGVAHSHRNGLHQIMTYTNGLMLSPEDRVTQLHSHGFSASRLDIFGALLNGAALFPLLPAAEGMSGLARRLIDEGMTLFHWVPTAFRHFADSLAVSPDGMDIFPRLRSIVLGSEPLTSRDVELFRRNFSPDCVLVNRFGATETGNIAWYFLNKKTSVPSGIAPVGYPVADAEVLVLDETGNDVGSNQIGEIAVKSAYLPPGYWRRSDLDTGVFSPAPETPGKTIYRTGDLGRRMPDGCLLHLGRKDFQVKIRGYRVEPGEIESALAKHPGIASAVVIARQDNLGDMSLAAYFVAATSPPPSTSMLRHYLEARLPAYMVPAAFTCLEALPLTPNGKVDRKSLPEPDPVWPDSEAVATTKSRTNVEEILAGIWSNVLGVGSVNSHDNFFDLGGNSLSAMIIISRTLSALNIVVSIGEFFETPTVAHMAELVGSAILKNYEEPELAEMLDLVESLSEDQANQLLKKETEE